MQHNRLISSGYGWFICIYRRNDSAFRILVWLFFCSDTRGVPSRLERPVSELWSHVRCQRSARLRHWKLSLYQLRPEAESKLIPQKARVKSSLQCERASSDLTKINPSTLSANGSLTGHSPVWLVMINWSFHHRACVRISSYFQEVVVKMHSLIFILQQPHQSLNKEKRLVFSSFLPSFLLIDDLQSCVSCAHTHSPTSTPARRA